MEALDAGICFSSRPRQTFSNSQPEQELPFKEKKVFTFHIMLVFCLSAKQLYLSLMALAYTVGYVLVILFLKNIIFHEKLLL